MNGLAVKDVDFNGSILRAAQDTDGTIWVGVRWVCEGLGLSEGQMKSERRKIQRDIVLSQGTKFHPLGSGNSDSDVLCLQLDFLPLWLAKIRVTPTIQREAPQLAENLITYQMKAKDVLAGAFLGQKTIVSVHQEVNMKELEEKVDKLYEDMHKFVNIFLDWKDSLEKEQPVVPKLPEQIRQKTNSWQEDMYTIMDRIYPYASEFNGRADIMKWIYRYMNRKYGIVWEQEAREFTERTGIYHPSTIRVVAGKTMLKSIFESILKDLEYKYSGNKVCVGWTDEAIAVLIEKYDDHSNAGMATYKKVYRKMDEGYKIGWKNLTTRYINQYGKTPSRKDLIETRPSLRGKFLAAINELMEE